MWEGPRLLLTRRREGGRRSPRPGGRPDTRRPRPWVGRPSTGSVETEAVESMPYSLLIGKI